VPPLPVADAGGARAGRNKEQCERSKRSSATMFLTGGSLVRVQQVAPNQRLILSDEALFFYLHFFDI
ncbi:MAG: hypothetical protein IKN72_06550, partial [Clostridia bacterium]|nr:hypothetical protein [Clostridia bacterium]